MNWDFRNWKDVLAGAWLVLVLSAIATACIMFPVARLVTFAIALSGISLVTVAATMAAIERLFL